ncbi:uncharacterized protein LOC113852144 [Abrus precatorius]|uniref:Uncharacterized protein LOC113852144 n=1 Tax=Abrus precatorius TaxID=3816 RepID=A0A8B8K520_ABRPR|nr:uncharacterized protein LOC113852144 [Abrus precatorius]
MKQPAGFTSNDQNLVYRLEKAIYGLKQAPPTWFAKLMSTFIQLSFHSARCDPSLFIHTTSKTLTYILVYVDEILITGNSSTFIQHFIHRLHLFYPLKDLGVLHCFLGLEVKPLTDNKLMLCQTKYITDLLDRLHMSNAKPIKTPLPSRCKFQDDDTNLFKDATLYRSVVEALQYVSITRPDVAFSINKLCQYMHRPLESHWKFVKRVIIYLKGTITHGLVYSPSENLHLTRHCDSNWASDSTDMRSTSGHCVFLGNNIIFWVAKKQNVVSQTSIEAKFRSIASLVVEICLLKSLLTKLKIKVTRPPLIWCDNLSAIILTANPVLHSKFKHFELDL